MKTSTLAVSFMVLTASALSCDAQIIGSRLAEKTENLHPSIAASYFGTWDEGIAVLSGSGLFGSRGARDGLYFSLGVHASGIESTHPFTQLDGTTVVTLDESWGVGPSDPRYGSAAVASFAGPSALGGEDSGSLLVTSMNRESIRVESALPGGLAQHTAGIAHAMPEIEIGGVLGLRAFGRYLAYEEDEVLGYGGSWAIDSVLSFLPIGLEVGGYQQRLALDDVVRTTSTTMFAAASVRFFSLIGAYGGVQLTKSNTDLDYTFLSANGAQEAVSLALPEHSATSYRVGVDLSLGLDTYVEAVIGEERILAAGIRLRN